jgi:anti-sigma factor RsiW
MTPARWHAAPELLSRYASGGLDHPAQAAVEAHLAGCASCQAEAATLVATPPLEAVWENVVRAISAPPTPVWHRALRRIGVRESDVVILRSSSGLHRPWVLSVAGALICAVLTSLVNDRTQDLLFLLIAPLVPVLAVVSAYDWTDPMREVAVATPLSKLRIALLRTAAATAVAVPVTISVGLIVPGISDHTFVWLLPSLALTLSTLVLLTWFTARTAGTATGGAWAAFITFLYSSDAPLVMASAQVQAAFAFASLLVGGFLVLRLLWVRPIGGYA